jgi:transcriptional regulator with XRE-family HTH domain
MLSRLSFRSLLALLATDGLVMHGRRGMMCPPSNKNLASKGDHVMNVFMMETADRIKSLRLKRGWTQEDLVANSGCAIITIQRAEAGKPLSAKTIASIAAAFNVPATDLTGQEQAAFEPYLPLTKITHGRPLVALLLGRSRIDFGFCELDNLDDAQVIEVFHGFCQSITIINEPLSPIALVTRELEARDHLGALAARGFQVGGAVFEITAYEIDDEDGGMGIYFGQWDVNCVALRVARSMEEATRAHVLGTLGKWETVKGDTVIYPPSTHSEDDGMELGLHMGAASASLNIQMNDCDTQ